MKVKTKTIISVLLVAFLIGFTATFIWGYRKGHQKGDRASQTTLDSLQSQIHFYKLELDKKQLFVYEIEQELKSLKEAKREGDIRNKELRALGLKKNIEVSRLRATVDTLLANIQHNGLIVITDTVETMPRNAILLPFEFEYPDKNKGQTDQWLTLTGTFNKQGELDINLKKDLSLDLWTGIDRKGKSMAKITTEDPYINIITINSIKTDTPKPLRHGVGLFVGYGLTKDLKGSPVIGIGLTRNLIRF